MASLPFAAVATVCPCPLMCRESKSRLFSLSSTTKILPQEFLCLVSLLVVNLISAGLIARETCDGAVCEDR